MAETVKRLFVGIKISNTLQNELDSPAPGTERYFKGDDGEFLQVVSVGEEKLIGRYVKDGFPVGDISDVSRNVRSIVKLITRGHTIGEFSSGHDLFSSHKWFAFPDVYCDADGCSESSRCLGRWT